MAEEHRCLASRLCANNCGFFGSPATQNLCSKCYRDLQLKEQQSFLLNQTLFPLPQWKSEPSSSLTEPTSDPVGPPAEEEEAPAQPSNCVSCRRRVGLTGFKCRCGSTYCEATGTRNSTGVSSTLR